MPEWLISFYQNWGPGLRILLSVVAALVIRALLQLAINRVVSSITKSVRKIDGMSKDSSPLAQARLLQRTETIASVLGNLATWGLSFTVISIALTEVGVSAGAIVAGAGILGAGLGFGAQSLVKDLISGLFIVFEDQYGVGDFVDLGQAEGVVESVGLRVTQVRDLEGTLWFVRNGEIMRVGNHSQGWARAVLDVAIEYSTDVSKAQEALLKAAKGIGGKALGEPEIWGINTISGDEIVLRLVQKTKPEDKDAVARLLRQAVKDEFDKAEIKLAPTSNVIYVNVKN
jgi:small conductance mechanosensitive channel